MERFKFLIITLVLLLSDSIISNTATSGENDKVELSQLKIIGRGIQNQKTSDIIALTCIGLPIAGTQIPSCKKLRHVKISAETNEVSYVGDVYDLNMEQEPTEDDFQKLVRGINKLVKQYKRDAKKSKRGRVISYAALGGAVAWEVHLLPIAVVGATVSLGATIVPFLALIAVTCVASEMNRIPTLPNTGVISTAMANQYGWNWSISPYKISSRKYMWIEKYLTH